MPSSDLEVPFFAFIRFRRLTCNLHKLWIFRRCTIISAHHFDEEPLGRESPLFLSHKSACVVVRNDDLLVVDNGELQRKPIQYSRQKVRTRPLSSMQLPLLAAIAYQFL